MKARGGTLILVGRDIAQLGVMQRSIESPSRVPSA
jgi:hypothetical protein